jgi:hypothetical protein
VRWNPRLIHVDITGFGDNGPDRSRDVRSGAWTKDIVPVGA